MSRQVLTFPGKTPLLTLDNRSFARVYANSLCRLFAPGQQVRVLVDEEKSAGGQTVVWDGIDESGRRPSSGAYMAQMRAGGKAFSRRILLLR